MPLWHARIIGNWLTSFLSPLIGISTAFSLDGVDYNTKVLLSATLSSLVVTGLIIAKELERNG